ncbi:hypothetical protein [Streptomyces sp. NPDC001315]|uniref:hypothetical protein n=1 Tax=Streptomyces sp. NPDC001315 TaxID=3364562 RepID=UPI00368193DE
MQDAADVAAYLLRPGRFLEIGPDAVVVDRPDQWWAVTAHLRRTASEWRLRRPGVPMRPA